MDEAYRRGRVSPEEGDGELGMPTSMEPTFSLAFFRRCQDGAVILNADGRIGFMNDAACHALGVSSFAEVVQRPWIDFWPGESEDRMRDAIGRVLGGDAVRLSRIESPSGVLDLLASPVMNKDGEVESVFAVLFPTGTSPRISG